MTSWHTVMYITCTSWLFYLTSVEKKTSRAPGFRIWVVLSMSLLSIRPKKRKFQWVSSLSFLFLSRIVSNHMLKMCTHAVMCVAYIESSCFFLFQLVHWKCLLSEDFYKWGVLVWYLDPIQWVYLVCSGLIDAAPIFVTLAKLILSRIFCGQVEMCQFPWTLTGIVIHKLEWCYWYYWSLCTVVNVQRYSSMDMSVTWSQPKFFSVINTKLNAERPQAAYEGGCFKAFMIDPYTNKFNRIFFPPQEWFWSHLDYWEYANHGEPCQ